MLFADIYVIILGLILFFIATLYSARPVRFKENGILGIITPALAQWPLPFMFLVFLVDSFSLLTWYLLGWLLAVGLIMELTQQLIDFQNDKKAIVKTWAQKVGLYKTVRITKYCFLLMIAYMMLPPFLFGIYDGIGIGFLLTVSSKNPFFYYRKGMVANSPI